MSAALWLDHATLHVPSLPLAVQRLEEVLGLTVVPTPTHAQAHARIWLDRSYLEVRAEGAWGLGGFFLGYPDAHATRAALASRGLSAREGPLYVGVDGEWEELHLSGPEGVPLPLLVKRVSPPELARDWPPPLRQPHPGGARTLAAVELAVADVARATACYRALARQAGASGVHGVELEGRGQLWLREEKGAAGLRALVLEVESLARLEQRARAAGAHVEREGTVLRIALPEAPQVGWVAVEKSVPFAS